MVLKEMELVGAEDALEEVGLAEHQIKFTSLCPIPPSFPTQSLLDDLYGALAKHVAPSLKEEKEERERERGWCMVSHKPCGIVTVGGSRGAFALEVLSRN